MPGGERKSHKHWTTQEKQWTADDLGAGESCLFYTLELAEMTDFVSEQNFSGMLGKIAKFFFDLVFENFHPWWRHHKFFGKLLWEISCLMELDWYLFALYYIYILQNTDLVPDWCDTSNRRLFDEYVAVIIFTLFYNE